MSKRIKVIIGVALTVMLAMTGFLIYALSTVGETLKEIDTARGGIAGFTIGTSKEALISSAGLQIIAHSPSPGGCTTGWVSSPQISSEQKACLLNTNEWGADSGRLYEFCPKNTDAHAALFFSQEQLARVNIRCTRPE